ncbi:MAG: hypothetical protein ACRD2L_19845 [Terriglobia bacterium]
MPSKTSRLRAVSTQPKKPSAPAPQAGSDGDLRHDQAAEPSPVAIASNDNAANPISPDPSEKEKALWRDLDVYEDIDQTLRQVQAVCHALYCVTSREKDPDYEGHVDFVFGGNETTGPLSALGIDTCRRLQQRLGECRSTLETWGTRAIARPEHHSSNENNMQKGKPLTPENQSFLDEVAHYLSFATPAAKAILELGIEGVKRKAAKLKALRSKSRKKATSQKASIRKG